MCSKPVNNSLWSSKLHVRFRDERVPMRLASSLWIEERESNTDKEKIVWLWSSTLETWELKWSARVVSLSV